MHKYLWITEENKGGIQFQRISFWFVATAVINRNPATVGHIWTFSATSTYAEPHSWTLNMHIVQHQNTHKLKTPMYTSNLAFSGPDKLISQTADWSEPSQALSNLTITSPL